MKTLFRNTILGLLLLAAAAIAQTTTVTATLSDAMGGHPSGTCSFQTEAQFTSGGGWSVVGVPRVASFTAGALSVALVPTDTATVAGQRYKKTCRAPLQTTGGITCEGNATLLAGGTCTVGPATWGPTYVQVPTSASPVALSTIETAASPAPIPSQWRGNYSATGSYRVGDGVLCQSGGSCGALSAGIAYVAIQGGSVGHTPGSSPTWWIPMHSRQAGDYDTYAMAPTAYWNFSAGSWRFPEKTFATMPAASAASGRTYVVTDSPDKACAAGGGDGTTPAQCYSNGTIWIAMGGGTTGLSGTSTWAALEAGTAGTGTITSDMTWATIEAQ